MPQPTRFVLTGVLVLAATLGNGCTPEAQLKPQSTSTATAQPSSEASMPESTSTQLKPLTGAIAASDSRKILACEVKIAQVNDPDAPLNVRSEPRTDANNVVGQLNNGTFVTVTKQQDDWLQITQPVNGWVSNRRVESGCNIKVERISLGKGKSTITVRDRFIGSGSHKYLLQAKPGQTLTITRQQGSLPAITSPQGETLLADAKASQTSWTGQLSQAGDYTLEQISNRNGYPYAFQVTIK